MKKALRWGVYLLLGITCGLVLAKPAFAQKYALEYWGGPVLEKFTIYPLYYGAWSSADVSTHQAYLQSLTAYISGQNAPMGQQPVIRQYGVLDASVADAVTAGSTATPAALTNKQLISIIAQNQASHALPPYGPNTMIALFLSPGFSLANSCSTCAFHASKSNTEYWLVVPMYTTALPFELLTAHEVFESASDPVVDNSASWGWLTGSYYSASQAKFVNDEAADECGDPNHVITLASFGIQIPSIIDNSAGVSLGNPSVNQPPGGVCSATGYSSTDEIQLYGWTLDTYKAQYATLFPDGWRIHLLEGNVVNGEVRYTVVFRRAGNTFERAQYGATLSDFKNLYNSLYPAGWRIYTFNTYVLNGTPYFNTVFRPSDVPENQYFDQPDSILATQYQGRESTGYRIGLLDSYAQPADDYDNVVYRHGAIDEYVLPGEPFDVYNPIYQGFFNDGWRIYILQPFVNCFNDLVYNAVFHKGDHGELVMYDVPYATYRAKYDSLWPDGWRLYNLQVYVMPDGETHYTAVWRHGVYDRPM
jgi:hypothetical protein